MPKQKTCKAAVRRFRVTRNGKVLYAKSGRRHLNSGMTGKHRRKMRRKGQLRGVDIHKIANAIQDLPTGADIRSDLEKRL